MDLHTHHHVTRVTSNRAAAAVSGRTPSGYKMLTSPLAPLALLQRNKDNIKQRLTQLVARPCQRDVNEMSAVPTDRL
jgi:hypothetical protein